MCEPEYDNPAGGQVITGKNPNEPRENVHVARCLLVRCVCCESKKVNTGGKILSSGLVCISPRGSLLCIFTWTKGRVAICLIAHNCGNYLGTIQGKTFQQNDKCTWKKRLQSSVPLCALKRRHAAAFKSRSRTRALVQLHSDLQHKPVSVQ